MKRKNTFSLGTIVLILSIAAVKIIMDGNGNFFPTFVNFSAKC